MGFMTLEHDFAVREEYARKEGLEEGQDKMAALGKALIGDGRSKDLEQAFSDPSFRDELYKEYGL